MRQAILPALIVIATFATAAAARTFSGVWQGGWIPIMIGATVVASIHMWKNQMRAFVPLFVVASLSGIAVGLAGAGLPLDGGTVWKIATMTNISVHVSTRMFSLISMVTILGMIAMAMLMTKRVAGYLAEALSIGGLLAALSILYQGLVMKNDVSWRVWFMDNPGCAATFCVFGLLWLLARTRETRELLVVEKRILTCALVTILVTMLALVKASTPIAAASVGLIFLLVREKPMATLALIPVVMAAAVVAWVGGYSITTDASGRLEMWTLVFYYWQSSWVMIVFGKGLGTTVMTGPLLTGQGWYSLHSSILQVAFELGVVGLAALSVAVGRVFYGLRSDAASMVVALAFLATMYTNFSSQIPLYALWMVALARRSI